MKETYLKQKISRHCSFIYSTFLCFTYCMHGILPTILWLFPRLAYTVPRFKSLISLCLPDHFSTLLCSSSGLVRYVSVPFNKPCKAGRAFVIYSFLLWRKQICLAFPQLTGNLKQKVRSLPLSTLAFLILGLRSL